jgi:hypothetical protein
MGLQRRLIALAACAALGPLAGAAHAGDAKPMSIDYHQWSSASQLAQGTVDGTSVQILKRGSLVLGTGLTTGSDPGDGRYSGHDYEMGSWTSQWYRPGFAFGELVSSWNAKTPTGTWIEVDMQESRSDSLSAFKTSDWWVMGVWASGDETIHRTSVSSSPGSKNQYGPFGAVYTDTFLTKKFAVAYRLRVKLFRLPGSSATPRVTQVGAVSSIHTGQHLPTSPLGGA